MVWVLVLLIAQLKVLQAKELKVLQAKELATDLHHCSCLRLGGHVLLLHLHLGGGGGGICWEAVRCCAG